MKLGFIVNPIAGMGGKVGLKGTDGIETLEKARKLGAIPEAPNKAKKALQVLMPIKDELEIYTCPGDMGENLVKEMGFKSRIIGKEHGKTSSEDTESAARQMLDLGLDLLLFAGGDGTARNIYNAIGTKLPVIGIPAGVKIHSAVYASYPGGAGQIVLRFLRDKDLDIKEEEVMDIDEDAFRQGVVTARLYGYMKIPLEPELMQSSKSGGFGSEEDALDGISDKIIEEMERDKDIYYIIGSGSSIKPIMDKLGLENTLLGIDIVKNNELIASDVNEKEILDIIGDKKAKIIVTVIGGQGYIFGRGNQQISKDVIKKVGKENVRVIATKNKLASLEGRPLLVDTGDEEVNRMFTGYIRVLTSYTNESLERIKGL